jgi:hypothetical protein
LKKVLIIMLAVSLAIGMLAIVGCGSSKTTIKTPEGNVTVDQSGGDTSVTYGGNTYTTSEKAPTEDELGAPIYPGANYVEGSGGTAAGTTQEGASSWASGEFTTSDSFDQVVSFYKSKLGEPSLIDTSTEKNAYWMINKGNQTATTVAITVDGGNTVITIANISGAGI